MQSSVANDVHNMQSSFEFSTGMCYSDGMRSDPLRGPSLGPYIHTCMHEGQCALVGICIQKRLQGSAVEDNITLHLMIANSGNISAESCVACENMHGSSRLIASERKLSCNTPSHRAICLQEATYLEQSNVCSQSRYKGVSRVKDQGECCC